jgi:hypothetical protein
MTVTDQGIIMVFNPVDPHESSSIKSSVEPISNTMAQRELQHEKHDLLKLLTEIGIQLRWSKPRPFTTVVHSLMRPFLISFRREKFDEILLEIFGK